VECPLAFTGANSAAVSVARAAGGAIYNTKIINNNINTQCNPLSCVYLKNAIQTLIEGNELYCDATSAAFTVTIASPGVLTYTAHGLVANQPVHMTTTGALPTGLVAGVMYYVKDVLSADTFTLSATPGGAAIATSGSQSGTHTLFRGAHIYIESDCRDTIIGPNKYYSSVTGAEIDPIIVVNGTAISGVWSNGTISLSGWTSQSTGTFHALGYFKTRDGNVLLRGKVAGAAAAVGSTIFTLPVGYRPQTRGQQLEVFGAVNGVNQIVAIQILTTGQVQILTANTTMVNFNGVIFGTG
jgi:hypothetical protein